MPPPPPQIPTTWTTVWLPTSYPRLSFPIPNPSLTATHSWVPQVLAWITVEEGSAELTVAPSCIVLTSITHASTHVARCQVYGHIKVAAVCMPMALTLLGEGKAGQRPIEGLHPEAKGCKGPSDTAGTCHWPEWGRGLRYFTVSASYRATTQSRLWRRVMRVPRGIKAWIPES